MYINFNPSSYRLIKLAQNPVGQQQQNVRPYFIPGSETPIVNILSHALNPFAGPAGTASQIAYEASTAEADKATWLKNEITKRHVILGGHGNGVLLGIRKAGSGYVLYIATAHHVLASLTGLSERDSQSEVLNKLRREGLYITLYPSFSLVTSQPGADLLTLYKPGTPPVHSDPVLLKISGEHILSYIATPMLGRDRVDIGVVAVYVDPTTEMVVRRNYDKDRRVHPGERVVGIPPLPHLPNEKHIILTPEQRKIVLEHLAKTTPDIPIVSNAGLGKLYKDRAIVYGTTGKVFPTPPIVGRFLDYIRVGGPGVIKYRLMLPIYDNFKYFVRAVWDWENPEFDAGIGTSGSGIYAVMPGPDGPQLALIGVISGGQKDPGRLNPPLMRDVFMRLPGYAPHVLRHQRHGGLLVNTPDNWISWNTYIAPIYPFLKEKAMVEYANPIKEYQSSTLLLDSIHRRRFIQGPLNDIINKTQRSSGGNK
jgi:hypothetical protein